MGVEFIKYLNSMNNASGDNVNALAESQVTNKYYDSIRVERKLGKFIREKIENDEHKVFIITGHAGDGKTSILIQVLKDLNLLEDGEKLKVEDIKSKGDIKVRYVKDMSELSQKKQKELLNSTLEAPKEGMSSILISNTGPLIDSFKELLCSDNDELKYDIENQLIKQLDDNKCEEICICGKEFYLINIARIKNIGFVSKFIDNICEESLWESCKNCENSSCCPIYFNRNCVTENKNRVISFIEMYYMWLEENDKRITVRQMLSQITFAFTGNNDCYDITKKRTNKYLKFRLNFANLFFGYEGIFEKENANQIKAIKLLQNLDLDSNSFKDDYEIFVKGDFSCFSNTISNIIQPIWNKYLEQVDLINEEEVEKINEYPYLIRKSIRRFLLMYGLIEDKNASNIVYDDIYGNMFSQYITAIKSRITKRDLNKLAKVIYEALYIKNVGVPQEGNSNLFLTLSREDRSFQNVLLVLAKIGESDLKVVQEIRKNEIEDIEESYILKLKIKDQDEFILTLPLMMYFQSILDGKIDTEINQSLSHGLSKLNAKLIKNFKRENEDETLSLIISSSEGIKRINVEVGKESIDFYS